MANPLSVRPLSQRGTLDNRQFKWPNTSQRGQPKNRLPPFYISRLKNLHHKTRLKKIPETIIIEYDECAESLFQIRLNEKIPEKKSACCEQIIETMSDCRQEGKKQINC